MQEFGGDMLFMRPTETLHKATAAAADIGRVPTSAIGTTFLG